jgi:hypothetical protein
MCSKSACSNQTLATLVTNVTSGCSTDLSSLGLDVQDVTTTVQQFYPTVRQILCLQEYVLFWVFASSPSSRLLTCTSPSSSTNQLCAVEGLYVIQNKTGTVSLDNISTVVPPISSEQDVACSNCVKAAYNIVLSNDPEVITSGVNSSLSNQCGTNFLGLPPYIYHCDVSLTVSYRW